MPPLNCSTNNCNKTDLICISTCSHSLIKQYNHGFQCNDGGLGVAFEFCDGNIDCNDNSDEIQNQPGFKCAGTNSNATCVLPQRNLYDGVAQCRDESDLCIKNNSCFECFDRRLLISSKQVCDGVFDCYDWSDECLCEKSFYTTVCSNRYSSSDFSVNGCKKNILSSTSSNIKNFTKVCQTRLNDQHLAILCDGRPECSDLSDECDCENPPKFCNDTCYNDYNIGDRFCDGVEDEFYHLINKSICSNGFDEMYCPKDFVHKNGNQTTTNINCSCDHKFDGKNFPKNHGDHLFCAGKEMIASPALKICFWITGVAAISGNLYVIFTTVKLVKKLSKIYLFQKLIILNIFVADVIMGIYLIAIAAYSVHYSGYYNQVDHEWRSSLRCSIIGSLEVVSSEASCLFITLLTIYRLQSIYKPFALPTVSKKKFYISIVIIWLISICLAVIPIPHQFSFYFVHSVKFSNKFTDTQIWKRLNITNFACRLAFLSNKSIKANGNNWDFTKAFLLNNFPEYSTGVEFGYYGQSSVCMPRLYIHKGENAWEYSLAIVLINLFCFVFIAIGYVFIYMHSTKNDSEMENDRRKKENAKMQRRISRIIISDFCCWIPVCILTFLDFSGFFMCDIVYDISASLLLPINSILNPFLYSPIFDKLIKNFKKVKKTDKEKVTNISSCQC